MKRSVRCDLLPGRRWPGRPDEGHRPSPGPRLHAEVRSRSRRPLIRPFGAPSPGGEGEHAIIPPIRVELVQTRVMSAEVAMGKPDSLLGVAARLDRLGISLTRVGLVVVLVWIGGLKMYRYEDEGIVPFVANSPADELLLPPARRGIPQAHEPGRRGGARQPRVAREERDLPLRLRPGLGDRRPGRDDRPASLAPPRLGPRQLPGRRDVAHDPVLPDHHARVLGPVPGRPGARLPAAVRCRTLGCQGRHHAWRRDGDHGRLGESGPAEARAIPPPLPRPRRRAHDPLVPVHRPGAGPRPSGLRPATRRCSTRP